MRPRDHGTSLVELLMGLAILAIFMTIAVPATTYAVDHRRARDAAGFLTAQLRIARQHAAVQSTTWGVVFDRVHDAWWFRSCRDGNGNGLRRAEIASGIDACPDGPHELGRMFPGVTIAVDASLKGPDGEPGSSDPVRFGSSDMASFSPEGSATAGSVYLRSARGSQYAVRVANTTGRTRTLRYDPGARVWR